MKKVASFSVLLLALATACATPNYRGIDWSSVGTTPLDRTTAQLQLDIGGHLAAARSYFDEILLVTEPRTIENTFVPYDAMLMHWDVVGQECGLLAAVHPDAAVREAAEVGSQKASAFLTEVNMSRELYQALADMEMTGADPVTRFAVDNELRDFRRSGVDKSDAVRARISQLSEELTELGQAWNRNKDGDVREIELDSVDDLAGLPADWIAKHQPGDDGLVRVNTTYPDYIPFIRYAESGPAREALYRVYNNRAYPENLEVLEQVLDKRYELATLYGYENWADYVTDDKMIESPENAQQFIDRINALCVPAAESEYALLLERKRRDDPGATFIGDWEKAYYAEKVQNELFAFDSQEARPYFDFVAVRQGLFDLTGQLFGLRYEQVHGLDLWHEDVTAWDLFEGERLIGRFYLDLHPRENKYGHAACFGYREGVGGKRLPQATLVCNFPNPRDSEDGHALMGHGEVTTFFHEFGHLLHALLGGHQPWMAVSGISTEWDFVEAPSQMLEEWCYDLDALRVFARHYQTGEPIPESLVQKLRLAEDFGKGMNNAHQMFYAALSLNYYNRPPAEVDLMGMLQELQERYSPFDYVEDTHFNASFGHLFGYSAIYYTYMWSQVIAKDMFSRFEDEGVLNEGTARDYRRDVLEAGGSLPAARLVEHFLGRAYSFESFERYMNTSPENVGEPLASE